MSESPETTFGLIIAFALPGFLLLWGVSISWNDLATWLKTSSPQDAPTIGAFLYVAVASLALGLLISAIRWATIEQILYRVLHVKRSRSSEKHLIEDGRRAAYQDKINKYYRYYQGYSHCLIAIVAAYLFNQLSNQRNPSCALATLIITIAIILFAKSLDELRSFNAIREELLAKTTEAH